MSVYDLLIIGGGPAGLSAGIYGARARLKTVILEKGALGGQAFTTREIVNYPGVKSASGPKLMQEWAEHAAGFGAELVKAEVTEVDLQEEIKQVRTKRGQSYQARAVILAPGSQPRLLNIPGERAFRGNGVSYCAACDAQFYQDLEVVVVGNGDAAVEEASYITKFARKVTIIVIHGEGIVDCNKVSAEKAFKNSKIEFVWNSVLHEIKGDTDVSAVVVKNLKTGALTERQADGVFIYAGMIPNTKFLQGEVNLNESGYVLASERMETSVAGVFVAGDVKPKYLRQVVTAAHDGAVAAVAAERYLEEETSFKEDVLASDIPVVLLFWNPRQNDCIDAVAAWEAAAAASGRPLKVVKVDVSRKQRLADKYRIDSVPAAVVVNKGKTVKTFAGVGTADAVTEVLAGLGNR